MRLPRVIVFFLLATPITVWAQAAAEYGMGAASSAARTNAAANALNRATKGVTERTSNALQNATTSNKVTQGSKSVPRPSTETTAPAPHQQATAKDAPPKQTPPANDLSMVGGLTISKQSTTKSSQTGEKYRRSIDLSFGK